jgi:hypothetical protein
MAEWKPHPKQEEALKRSEFEVLYGGSRGGGKTDAGIVWLTEYLKEPRFRALVIRRNADDLSDWLDRAYKILKPFGIKIAYRPAVLTFPSGAVIRTGHLKDANAYTKYQGHEYSRILIEELTQIPTEKLYLQLTSSCRTSNPKFVPQIFLTTNPGNLGHSWVKKRFIDVAPVGKPYYDKLTKKWRVYIPATIDDNPTLKKADPSYVTWLDGLKETDEQLWKAWRYGDWDIFAGQFFREFRRDIHTVRPFEPKPRFAKVGSMDWGYNAPFCFLASAVQTVDHRTDDGDVITFQRVWTYKEFYGTERSPKQWAELIQKGFDLSEFKAIYCDPSMFHRKTDGSESIAKQFQNVWLDKGHLLRQASNDRLAGWSRMHDWLSIAPDDKPYWYISEACHNLIRTLPEMQHNDPKTEHDELRIEDINTTLEDHAVDAARYKLVSLKWIDAKSGAISPKAGMIKGVKKPFMYGLDLDKFARAKI